MGAKLWIILFIIAVEILVLTSKRITLDHMGTLPSTLSDQAPDFIWKDAAGIPHKRSEWAGKKLVLHFWASWCLPCRIELPGLLRFAKSQPGTEFLLVSADEQQADGEKFMAKMRKEAGAGDAPNIHYGFDPERRLVYDMFQTLYYPETILMDSHHVMRQKFSGAARWDSQDVRDLLITLP